MGYPHEVLRGGGVGKKQTRSDRGKQTGTESRAGWAGYLGLLPSEVFEEGVSDNTERTSDEETEGRVLV